MKEAKIKEPFDRHLSPPTVAHDQSLWMAKLIRDIMFALAKQIEKICIHPYLELHIYLVEVGEASQKAL